MFKISKKSQYGLRAMVCLAKNHKGGQILSVKEISKREAIPFDFLGKIISKLANTKLLESKKGVEGGYCLAKPASKISVANIVGAIEGKNPVVNCEFCQKSKKCPSKNVWQKIDDSINKTLESIKLSEIV